MGSGAVNGSLSNSCELKQELSAKQSEAETKDPTLPNAFTPARLLRGEQPFDEGRLIYLEARHVIARQGFPGPRWFGLMFDFMRLAPADRGGFLLGRWPSD